VTITETHFAGPGAALSPAGSQLAFRAVLDALARPGLPAQLPVSPESEPALPAVLLPLLALADLGTGVCLLGAEGFPRGGVDDLQLEFFRGHGHRGASSRRCGNFCSMQSSTLLAVPCTL